ncbi:MAG: FtsW/RodA/SpoVE family cell cycle protein, partial [Micrococcaceae bacterium]|nr:FtsW/RodA/SpoVE family cell cycle protein [Micrococcaceae bacterium]
MSELKTVPVPRRNMELLLLLLALAVAMGAYYLVGANSDNGLSKEFITQGLFLAGLALVFHVILRIWAKYADPVILPVAVALNGIGLAMIHRIDLAANDDTALRQILWTGVAMVVAMIVLWAIRDHRILRRFTYIALAASVLLLVLPLIKGLGVEINGARIWVNFFGLSFQPGELAKITLAIFFAGYLSSNRELILLAGKKLGPMQLPRARDLGPMIVAWMVSIGVLVIQKDLGSSIL